MALNEVVLGLRNPRRKKGWSAVAGSQSAAWADRRTNLWIQEARYPWLSWNIMKYYEILWNIMKYYEILWNIRKYYEILWNIMKYYEILGNIRKYYEILWNIMKYYEILWRLGDEIEFGIFCSIWLSSFAAVCLKISQVFNCLSSSLAPAIDLNVCQEQRMWTFIAVFALRTKRMDTYSLVPTISFIRRSRYGITHMNIRF